MSALSIEEFGHMGRVLRCLADTPHNWCIWWGKPPQSAADACVKLGLVVFVKEERHESRGIGYDGGDITIKSAPRDRWELAPDVRTMIFELGIRVVLREAIDNAFISERRDRLLAAGERFEAALCYVALEEVPPASLLTADEFISLASWKIRDARTRVLRSRS